MASFVFTSVLTVLQSAIAAPAPAPAPPPVVAQIPTIAVVGLHQASVDPAAQRQAVLDLVKAIEATGKFDGVPTGEVRTGILGRESVVLEEGLLSVPREKLTLGRTAYNQASWDEAIVHLTDAITGFRAMFPGSNNAEDLWDAYLYLGSSQLLRDHPNEDAARAAFASAAAMSPAKPINPALFPPNVAAMYESVRTQLRAAMATVQVSAGPGSEVWLDGIQRGAAPLSIADVPAGEHHLVARAPAADGYLKFTVGTNLAPRIELPMTNPTFGTAAASPASRSRQVAGLYESLAARSVGLDYVLIAGTVDTTLFLQLFDTRSRTYSRPLEVPFVDAATDEALRALPLLLNGVTPDGGFVTAGAAPPPLDVSSNCELVLLLTERVAAEPFSGAPAFPGAPRVTDGRPPPLDKEPRVKSEGGGKAGTVIGVVVGVLAAGGAAAGGYYFLSQQDRDPNQGSVIVQF